MTAPEHDTDVVNAETAYAAWRRSMEHVVGEHFTYRGRRVYSPHLNVGARLQLCDERRFDARQPIAPPTDEID